MDMKVEELEQLITQPKTNVLLLNGPDTIAEALEGMVSQQRGLIVSSISAQDLKSESRTSTADIAVAQLSSLSSDNINLLSELTSYLPNVPLIVITPPQESSEARHLFKFNVLDWLTTPIDEHEFLEGIRRGARSNKAHNHQAHAIISAVGGAGASTLAVSIADLAASKIFRKNNKSVALFDLDFSTGNCGYVINMVNKFNLATVVSTPRRVDSEFIRVIQQQHESGFYLYSFKQPELNTELNAYELVLRMLDAVTAEHEVTFFDIPYYETDWKDDVLAAVNTCTLVSELNLPAIKHTLDQFERIRTLRGPDFLIQVVFNKCRPTLFGQTISKKRIEELFGETPIHYIPMAYDVVNESMDRGVPPSALGSRTKFMRRVNSFVSTLKLTEAKVS